MATYIELYDEIFADPGLEKQTVIACLTIADGIIREDPGTSNHDLRLQWARAVVANPLNAARKMMPVVVVNPTVQAGDFTDGDILWLISVSVEGYAPVI